MGIFDDLKDEMMTYAQQRGLIKEVPSPAAEPEPPDPDADSPAKVLADTRAAMADLRRLAAKRGINLDGPLPGNPDDEYAARRALVERAAAGLQAQQDTKLARKVSRRLRKAGL